MNLAGVDLGVHKVALAGFVSGDYHNTVWQTLATNRSLQLHELAMSVRDTFGFWHIHQVWIEDTLVGNNRKYSIQLTEVRGAVMAALAMDFDVRLVNNKTWKKQIVGDGNASKDSVRDYIHVTHGAYAPLCGSDQDLYDATCIALYARHINDQAQDLRLVP